jgi:hypothetical protein
MNSASFDFSSSGEGNEGVCSIEVMRAQKMAREI